jgi:hypothetical protein
MTATGRPWTSEEDDQIRSLIAANRNIGVIARELKRTEAAVTGRVYQLGIRLSKPTTRGLGARKIEKPAPQ